MAKILLINSSHRKKNTYGLLKKIEHKLDSHETEIVHISDYNIKPCVGCENCMRKGTCHINDDAELLLNKMIEADGIVIGAPIYLRQIPGVLKVLFDRGCSWYHRSPMVGKPILFVTTTQVTGTKSAITYLKDLSVQWGSIYSGEITRTMFKLDNPVNEKDLKRFKRYLDSKNLKKYRPSMKHITEFNTQKVLAEEVLPLDLQYWTDNGYIEAPYFFKCRINFCKRFIGFIFYKFLKNIISKNKEE